MGDDIIANGQPVRLLDTEDNPFGVQSNPLVVQFNGSIGVVQVTGTVPVSFPTPVTVNGTVVAITSSPGTQPVQIVGQPVVVTVANPTGTVAISTNPVPIFGQVTVGSHAVGVVGPVTVNGTVAISTNPVPVAVSGTQSVIVREQPIQVAGTVTALFNEGTELVRITGQPVSVNGTVAISTSPVPVTFDSTGTLNTVIRQQPVQVFGTVVATGVSVSVGTVAISTNPVPVSGTVVAISTASGTVFIADELGRITSANPLPINGTVTLSPQPIQIYGTVSSAPYLQNRGRFHGYTLQSGIGIYPVRPTTYTPQATGAQRSINSTSANDTAAGTGARKVRISYWTQTGTGTLAGPFYETLILNGTAGVNTVATNIRYVSDMEVMNAGSGGVNAGIIQLWTGTGATGSIFFSIAASDYCSQSCHYYVPSGYAMFVTGLTAETNAAIANLPGVAIRSLDLSGTDTAERLLIPDVRCHQYAPVTHTYESPPQVNGPALVTAYYKQVNNNAQTGWCDVGYLLVAL
jgi:hypothetical protein